MRLRSDFLGTHLLQVLFDLLDEAVLGLKLLFKSLNLRKTLAYARLGFVSLLLQRGNPRIFLLIIVHVVFCIVKQGLILVDQLLL